MDAISAAAELSRLRAQFPLCGIIHDPFAERWVAVAHTGEQFEDRTPAGLRRQLSDRSFHRLPRRLGGGARAAA